MKKGMIWGLGISLVVIAGIGSFIYSLPYFTLNNIIKGMVDNDPELLSDNIDFPRLQSNLKDSVKKAINAEFSPESFSEDPLEAFGQGFSYGFIFSLAEGFINQTVTPTALGSVGFKDYKKNFLYYIPGTESGYKSSNKFFVSKDNKYAKATLILTRKGLHWELTNITISNINKDAIARDMKKSWQEEIAKNFPNTSKNYSAAPQSPFPVPSRPTSPEPEISQTNVNRPDPIEFISNHYASLNSGSYDNTWASLSSNFSSSLSYSDYTDWWDSVSEIQLNNITVISQDGDTARVKADLTYVMNDGRIVKDKKPFINLVWDSNSESWLIDQKSD
jgi:hypothetical protein